MDPLTQQEVSMKIELTKSESGNLPMVVLTIETLVVVLCNFRRYGWAWSKEPDALKGGGFSGIIWPNQDNCGMRFTSVEDVIRVTFGVALARIVAEHGRMADLVYHHEALPVLDELLLEALGNPRAREWAKRSVNSTNGLIGDIEVIRAA